MSTEPRRRAYRGYSYDPCQGCGDTEQRPKNTLCRSCYILLEAAREAKAQRERADTTVQAYNVPQRPCDMPYVNEHVDGVTWDDGRPFTKALHELLMLVSTPTELGREWGLGSSAADSLWNEDRFDRRSVVVRTLPPAVAAGGRDTFNRGRAAIKRAYTDGHADGRKLLLQLASGSITADAFNEAAARIDKER